MKVHQEVVEARTRGRGLVDFGSAGLARRLASPAGRTIDVTARVAEAVSRSGVVTGLCTVFVQHTSASLVIQENADPAVRRDLERWLEDLAPESRAWEHDDEGPDDMPAHARGAITRTSETLPVTAGRLALGTWQGLYLWEHRRVGHTRRLVVTVQGVGADA